VNTYANPDNAAVKKPDNIPEEVQAITYAGFIAYGKSIIRAGTENAGRRLFFKKAAGAFHIAENTLFLLFGY